MKDTFPPALFNHKTGPDPSTQSKVQRPEPIPPKNSTNSSSESVEFRLRNKRQDESSRRNSSVASATLTNTIFRYTARFCKAKLSERSREGKESNAKRSYATYMMEIDGARSRMGILCFCCCSPRSREHCPLQAGSVRQRGQSGQASR